MVTELATGFFALGGVALTALLAEIRARRETRVKEHIELTALKRKTYSTAIQQVEIVASKFAQWIDCIPEEDATAERAFWDALTIAYQLSNEIRILGATQEPADAMKRMLTVYRKAMAGEIKVLPKPKELRAAMVDEFRNDLGLAGPVASRPPLAAPKITPHPSESTGTSTP
ncbi:hypothetical protein [Actinoplanes sp. NPDC051411]|uniref:hypothetical protein n=1 Tax=Actinoplanes sp. NPDC051411 TaxID=3155522 RepID=UPI00342BFE23